MKEKEETRDYRALGNKELSKDYTSIDSKGTILLLGEGGNVGFLQ